MFYHEIPRPPISQITWTIRPLENYTTTFVSPKALSTGYKKACHRQSSEL